MADPKKPSVEVLREMKARLNAGRKQLDKLKYDLSDEDYAKALDMFSKKEKEFNDLTRGAFHKDIHKIKRHASEAVLNPMEEIARIRSKAERINPNEIIGKVEGVTDKFDTLAAQNIKSGGEFVKDIAEKRGAKKAALEAMKKGGKQVAKKLGKKVLSAIPIVGGIASALQSGDVMAAIPGLESEGLGLQEGMKGYRQEMPTVASELDQGRMPGRLRDATMGALDDLAALRAKKKKNLVEE